MFLEFQILRNMSGKHGQSSERLKAHSIDPDLVDLKGSFEKTRTGRECRVMGACTEKLERQIQLVNLPCCHGYTEVRVHGLTVVVHGESLIQLTTYLPRL